jgi:uncharacterized protein (TIRG00374 family)
MYQGLFSLVGNKIKYKFLYKASLELNFINHIFPSGGVSGISYFGMRLRDDKITGSRATLVQIMKLLMYGLSFEALLVFGLIFMAVGNRVNDLVIMITTLIATLLIMATLVFVAIIGSENRIRITFSYLSYLINKLIALVRKDKMTVSISRIENSVLDLHANYKLIEARFRDLKWTFFWAFMANLTEILCVYVVYVAFGKWVNFGAVILAYGVANFAGLVSILPGGVGIYEGLMTVVLSAAGVPARLSLPVTVMYRVMNTLIQLPAGYYYYHKNLSTVRDIRKVAEEVHDD